MHPTLSAPAATTPPPLPSLTVSDTGRIHLHAALAAQLQLHHGQPGNVVPPPPGSPYWHLDLRAEAERIIELADNRRFRIRGVRLPLGLLDPDEPPLTLYLLPGEPAQPGYYPLLPAPAFEQAYTAFLAQAAQAARRGEALPQG